MGKTRVKTLKVKHFRSIRGEIEVQLPEHGMVLIRSRNLDSNGSSGGGKSSLLLALNAALDCCPFSMTELQSWGVEAPVSVSLDLESDTHGRIQVTRGSKSSLKVGDEKPTTSAKAVQERLQQIIGLSPDLLAALTYSPQQDLEDFLTKTNAEKQEFLSALLGLGAFETAVEKAQENLIGRTMTLNVGVRHNEELWARNVQAAKAAAETLEPLADGKEAEDRLRVAQQHLQEASERLVTARQAQMELDTAWRPRLGGAGTEFTAAIEQAKQAVTDIKTEMQKALLDSSSSPELDRLVQMWRVGHQKVAEVLAQEKEREREFRAQCQALDTETAGIKALSRHVAELRKQVAAKQSEIQALEASSCPTCKRQWDEAQAKVAARRGEVEFLEEQVRECSQKLDSVPALEQRRAAMVFEPNPLLEQLRCAVDQIQVQKIAEEQKQIQAKTLIMSEFAAKVAVAEKQVTEVESQRAKAVSDLKLQYQQERSVVDLQVTEAQRTVSDATTAVKSAESALKDIQNQNALAKQRNEQKLTALAAAEREHQCWAERRQSLEAEIAAEQDFIKLVGREGFLGAIFDEVLAEISAETNAILGRVANTAHVTLEFRSETETKSGKVRKEIKPVVTIGGHEAPLKSGCSGGMYTAVRLAVRLAVRAVVSRRTGSFPGWLVLDEAFEGLDLVSKEACMEILAEAGKQDLILVVDHSSEFKELFTQFIDLEYRGGETRLAEAT